MIFSTTADVVRQNITISEPAASSFAVLAVFAPLATHAATASLLRSITISS